MTEYPTEIIDSFTLADDKNSIKENALETANYSLQKAKRLEKFFHWKFSYAKKAIHIFKIYDPKKAYEYANTFLEEFRDFDKPGTPGYKAKNCDKDFFREYQNLRKFVKGF